jgi:hypothetical protein
MFRLIMNTGFDRWGKKGLALKAPYPFGRLNCTPFSPSRREALAFNFCTTSARVNPGSNPMSR